MTLLVAAVVALAVVLFPTRRDRVHEVLAAIGARDSARSRSDTGNSRGHGWVQGVVPGRARRERARAEHDLNLALGSLEAALDAGLAPAEALRAVHDSGDARNAVGTAMAVLAQRAGEGYGVPELWLTLARRPGLAAAAQVGRAWAISERTGAPLSRAVGSARAGHRRTSALRRAVETQTAGPRATMGLLTLLPCAGPLLLPIIGVPLRQAFSLLVLLVAVFPGVVLLLIGRTVMRRMIRSALAEGAT